METCRHNGSCGGCIYQGIPYQEQVELKGRTVLELLKEAKVPVGTFLGVSGSPSPYAYRNKMEYTFGDEVKDGEMTLGMHKQGNFMSVITVDGCQLVPEDFNRVLRATLDFCREKEYPHFHKRIHKGLMRNLILRRGVRTGELLVNIVTTSQMEFAEEEFKDMILSLPLELQTVGILHTFNDDNGDGVNCGSLKLLFGRDYYEEEILGLRFHVGPFSFFQTNVEAVERLYADALELAGDPTGKVVYDLYCGTGTITQSLALKAKEAVGVEIVEEAVALAEKTATANGLQNCRFIAGDVLKVLDTLPEQPDILVVDPPRAGIHSKALYKILRYGVPQIIYISCNPKTLAKDLASAQLMGYQAETVKVYDNFPFTKHVECVVLITKSEAIR